MAFRPVAIATLFVVCLSFHTTASKQCGSYTYSIFQKMLRGHTFRTIQVRAGSVDCIEACNSDVRCQSLNFVMFEDLCELNNRTKEARPEDFVENMNRYYMMKSSERVPLGSISELPADSCREIKASEGDKAVNGRYWLTTPGSHSHVSLSYCLMKTVDVGCVDVNPNEEGTVHVVNADHGVWPDSGFCRVIFEQDIKAVGPYVLDIELLNTVRPGIVYWGHPGVIYNVVDEDNFDFVYFRLPSGSNNCYQVGYSSNGNNYYTNTASCPGGTPNSGKWFKVRVQIDLNRNVAIYYKGTLVKSYTAHFGTKVSGGVLVTNGFRNIIQFSNFSISQQ